MQPKLICLGRHLFQWSVVKSSITSELNGKKHQFIIISQFCRLIVPSWAVITCGLRGGCRNLEAGTCSHVKAQLGQLPQVAQWCAVAWELNWGCQPSCLYMWLYHHGTFSIHDLYMWLQNHGIKVVSLLLRKKPQETSLSLPGYEHGIMQNCLPSAAIL